MNATGYTNNIGALALFPEYSMLGYHAPHSEISKCGSIDKAGLPTLPTFLFIFFFGL